MSAPILHKRELTAGIGLSILALCVYLAFPTRNYYWDGISFALQIENARGLEPMLFNPNHLGYDSMGYALFLALRTVLPAIRALSILVKINQILGAVSALFIFRILGRYTQHLYSRVCLTLIFMFSATWWKFSTDADVYVPSTFCLIAAFSMFVRAHRKPNIIAIGLLHALAMLFHQIAVFFYVPAVTAIFLCGHWRTTKEKLRIAMAYSITAGSAVAVPYILVWTNIVNKDGSEPWVRGILNWMTSNGTEEYVFQSLPHSLIKTAQSTVRLFFGGRLSLARDFVEAPILIALGILLLFCGGFFMTRLHRNIMKSRSELPAQRLKWFTMPSSIQRSDAIVCLSWTAPFLVFLLFWLTEWPYYRLFYLPAIIGLIACVIEKYRRSAMPTRSYALAGFAAVMILSNFIFLIYPFTKTGATPPVHLALGANSVWDEDSVVFYRSFNTDNRTFQYFNRQARWETVNADVSRFKDDLCSFNSVGYNTWIDATGLEYLASFPDADSWLEGVELHDNSNLLNSKHHIHFMQVVPNCDKWVRVEDPANHAGEQ